MSDILLAELDRLVIATLGPSEAAEWWMRPNPMLDNLTPGEAACDDPERLAAFVRGAWGAHQPSGE